MAEQYLTHGYHVPVTTTLELPGYKIVRHIGIVRGITVRSRGLGPMMVAAVNTMVGGKIEVFVSLCEAAREEAMQFMLTHAREQGANAVIGFRYDATELAQGVTEVLAYGTAVVVEPL
jgi:uncharacterized protein YbjQ (UPF0145 family)